MLAMVDFVYEYYGLAFQKVVSQRLHIEDAVVRINIRIFSQVVELE